MNTDFFKKIVLYLLLALALFLGYHVYKQNYPSTTTKIVSVLPPSRISSDFSEEEKKLLVPPQPGASKEEVDTHSKLAAKLAVIGEKVVIKDCKATPLVSQTKFGNSVVFENQGSSTISISFDNNNVFEVGAGKTVSSKKAFVHGPGLYGYLCIKGDFKGLVGFILLTQ